LQRKRGELVSLCYIKLFFSSLLVAFSGGTNSMAQNLFACLFNDTVISSDCRAISSNNRTINDLEGIWEEAVVSQFDVPSRHLPAGTEEKHETPSHFGRTTGLEMNPNQDWQSLVHDV
jgi:hypothetical protein